MVRRHIEKIPSRKAESHKGDYGRVLVLAGSKGMTGAAYLTSQAAVRSGSGIVLNAIPDMLNSIMEIKLTEVMTLPIPLDRKKAIAKDGRKILLDEARKCSAVAIGPGLGTGDSIKTLVREMLKRVECPVILDADGINALEGKLSILKKRKGMTIITPHPGEMARLIRKDTAFVQLQRPEIAKDVAAKAGVVVCLKGHKTVVAGYDRQVYVNSTGNSGMATAGTGDVLTGMITSFVGQGIDLFGSAVSGAYLHGLAGDIAAEKKGPFSMIASDIIEFLPEAFKRAGIY